MLYIPKRFILQELVSPPMFKEWGARCWEFLDPRWLVTIDTIAQRYGTTTINTWHLGGDKTESGLRDPRTTTGAGMSQHKFGRAGDMRFKNKTPQEVHADLIKNAVLFPELRVLEAIASTPTWVHADVRQHSQPQQIWIVNPV